MDRIKNMDQLYTWTSTYSDVLEDFVKAEQYHGTDYCKQVITDVLSAINWEPQEYLGELGQIANEVFKANSPEGAVYRIEFAINTYEKKVACARVCQDKYGLFIYDFRNTCEDYIQRDSI